MTGYCNLGLRKGWKNIVNSFKSHPEDFKDDWLLPKGEFDYSRDSPYPFIIDVVGESYFYPSEEERDHDLALLKAAIEKYKPVEK